MIAIPGVLVVDAYFFYKLARIFAKQQRIIPENAY